MKIRFFAENDRRKIKAYLIRSSSNTNILLDCGIQAQSIEEPILPNYIIPDKIIPTIKAIFITHAHLDHWGLLPQLIIKGYSNSVYMTEGTYEMLAPATKFYFKNIYNQEKKSYHQALTKIRSMVQIRKYGAPIELKDFIVFFLPANHILGSAQIIVEERNSMKQILYTGDINPRGSSLFKPLHVQDLINEYNIKIHPQVIILETSNIDFTENDHINEEHYFIKIINEIFDNFGDVLIPVRAIGDAQDFLTRFLEYILEKKIKIPLNTFTIGSLLLVNEIYIKHKDKFRNPVLVDLFSKTLVLKRFSEYLQNNSNDVGNKLFIATGGNLMGSALNIYKFLGKHSQNLIIKTNNFDVSDCKAKVICLKIFSLHGNRDSILTYINEFEHLNNIHFFLVHGYYDNLKEFSQLLNEKKIKNIIPELKTNYTI